MTLGTNPLAHLLELLHRALRSQAFHAPEHPQSVRHMEALGQLVEAILRERGGFRLVVEGEGFTCQGFAVLGAPNAAQSLAADMTARGVAGLEFRPGLQLEDLNLFLFILQLRPQRLAEMGGPGSLLPDDGLLLPLSSQDVAPAVRPRPIFQDEEHVDLDWQVLFAPDHAAAAAPKPDGPGPSQAEAADSLPPLDVEAPGSPILPEPPFSAPAPALEAEPLLPPSPAPPGEAVPLPSPAPPGEAVPLRSPVPPGEAVPLPSPVPPGEAVPLPSPPPPGEAVPLPSPAALAEDLRPLFLAAVASTSPVLRAGPHAPWDLDHRDALKRFGFEVPDFTGLAGFGARFCLDAMPSASLRDALRRALSSLEAFQQGNVLLGLPGFPPEEHALRRALDFLAPELLAQAVAHAHVRHQPSRFDLALLTVALMQCVHDRELSMEAIRGRLQFEGWGIEEVEAFKEAVQWECQGTDTKLNLSLERHAIHEQDPGLVMTLGRQLIRGRRLDDLRGLLSQLDEELASPLEARRRHGAEILGDLAVSMQEANLSQDLERRVLASAHERLWAETDEQVAQCCTQAMEAILGRWIFTSQFHGVYEEMVALGELAQAKLATGATPAWKTALARDLLARVGGPANIALLLPLLHVEDGEVSRHELHAILNLMGTAAASSLGGWLEFEEDPARRVRMAEALQAMGPRAVPALKEGLASPHSFMVEIALQLLAKAGDPSALPGMLLAITHWDAAVRKAAVTSVATLAGTTAAAKALAAALPEADLATRLEYLLLLGDLGDPVAIPAVLPLVQDAGGHGEDAQRLRLRAVEVLGLIPSPDSVRVLQDLFVKKGLFKGRETLSLRLAAAQALAAINTREARESMALALENEPQEEVRTVLKQYLVR